MLACAGTDGERNRSEIQPSGMLIWCLCLHRDSSLSSKWYHWWRREPCFYRYDPFALKFLAPLLNEMLISIKQNQNTDPFILFFHRGVFIEFRSVEISTKMVTYVVALATAAPHWVLLVSYFCLCCQRLGRPADLCRYWQGKREWVRFRQVRCWCDACVCIRDRSECWTELFMGSDLRILHEFLQKIMYQSIIFYPCFLLPLFQNKCHGFSSNLNHVSYFET